MSKEISQWNSQEVLLFLKNLNISNKTIQIFEKNLIDGYDLCKLNEDDNYKKLDLNNNIHEKNIINRNIYIQLLEQLKINFFYNNQNFIFQLDFLPVVTVDNLCDIICKSINKSKENFILSTMDDQILLPQLNIIENLLLNPEKYKNLKIFNSQEKISNNIYSSFNSKQMLNKNTLNDNKINNNILNDDNKFSNTFPSNVTTQINTRNIPTPTKYSNTANNNNNLNTDINNNNNLNKFNSNLETYKNRYENLKTFDIKTELNSLNNNNKDEMGKFTYKFSKDIPNSLENENKIEDKFKKFDDFDIKKITNNNNNLEDKFKNFKDFKNFDTKSENPSNNSKNFNEYKFKNFDLNKDLINNNKPKEMEFKLDNNKFLDFKKEFKEYKPINNINNIDNNNIDNNNDPKQKFNSDYNNMFKKYSPSNLDSNINNNNNNINKLHEFSNDLNSQTNYIFNSNELNTYEQLQQFKKNNNNNNNNLEKNNSYENLVKESGKKDDNNNILNNMKFEKYDTKNIEELLKNNKFDMNNNKFDIPNNNNLFDIPNNNNNDFNKELKRYQSEKRSFRTFNNNPSENQDLNNNLNDFKPKDFNNKFSQDPLDVDIMNNNNNRFNPEKFNRYSSTTRTTSIQDDNNNNNILNENKISSLRGQFDNFSIKK